MNEFRKAQLSQTEPGEDGLGGLDSKQLTRYLRFALGSVRRRPLLAGLVCAAILGLTISALALLPKGYHVETKILAQRQAAFAGFSRTSSGDDAPTYAALEIIKRRDNLLSLIEKAHAADRWQFTRGDDLFSIIPNLMDRLHITRPPTLTKEDKINILVGYLDSKLSVTIGEGTLTLAINWPDPQVAYELVEAALQNFLDARRSAEISTIDESIAVVQARAEGLRSEIETMENELRAGTRLGRKGLGRLSEQPRTRFDPAASQLKAMLEARRRVIREAEDVRLRRLEELQVQLAEKQAVYGDTYPIVVNLKQEIQSYSKEPQRVAALRAEERELEAAYNRRIRGADTLSSEEGATSDVGRFRRSSDPTADEKEEQARLRYETLLERIESARIERDTARTAFKYRYSVIWPAKIPSTPDKPNVPRGLILGTLLAMVMSALAAVLADYRSGRFVERWQVERVLDLPVLGEVQKP